MQRAATGLATVCLRLLPQVYGARVVLLVGSGNNGGDALYAGARLARRGAAGARRPAQPGAGARRRPGGLPAGRRAGRRPTRAVLDRADLVLDGIVGIGGERRAAARRRRAASPAADGAARASLVAVDVPSGVDADTGERRRDRRARRRHGDVRHVQARAAGGPGRGPGRAPCTCVDIGLDAHLPEPAARSLQTADVADAAAPSGPGRRQVPPGVVGVVAGSAAYPGAAVLTVAGALRAGRGDGPLRRGAGAEPSRAGRRWPEVVVDRRAADQGGRRCRPGWSARASAPTTQAAACCARC